MTTAVHFPRSAEGKRFCEFFSHRYNFIEAEVSQEHRPNWRLVRDYPLEHRNLWARFLDPKRLIGVSFGSLTRYVLLDIDRNSSFHPANNEKAFQELLGAYEDIGLNECIVLQSSWSEGIHVYFVFPKLLPTFKVAQTIKLTAIRSGFPVKDGTLEIFPNTKTYNKEDPTPYKAHRLPLQAGSYLLDRNFVPYSNNIKVFLDHVEESAKGQDIELFEAAIKACEGLKAKRSIKGDGSKAAAFAADLKEQIEEGWSDFGQTNDLLRIIGTFGRVFQALGGSALAEYIATTAKSLAGYQTFCRHQHNIHQRALDWARCVEKFYYPYGSEPLRSGTFADMTKSQPKENTVNENRQKSAIERIQQGVLYLKETLAELPKRAGEMKEALLGAIKKLFGVRPSDKTLYRYRELWLPEFILPTEPKTPQSAPQAKQAPCPTPAQNEPEKDSHKTGSNPLSEAASQQSATPPLYMKVAMWASSQISLVYRGAISSGLVFLEGEKREQLQSIHQNDEVVIESCNHSSFLFNPDNENNLLVYVVPTKTESKWINGVTVRALDLIPTQ
ncbi:MAG: hypothetical protein QNJ54_33070 [Prochloraceae cyanobacterium]|nr:hypothetical protein [Prochloraceae cyanobacterium]